MRLVVLGHGFWMRHFGGDRAVIGRALTLDRETFTIVGVMNQGFEPGYAPSELWTPLDIRKGAEALSLSSVQSIGRLAPGVTAAQAEAELESIRVAALAVAPALLKGWTPGAIGLRQAQFGSQRAVILMLLAAAAGLALIAIANLANLTLADVLSRRADFAIRAALGGSRFDLAAPEVLQSLVIAGVGGAAGMLAASWLMPAILSLDPSTPLARQPVPTDWRVVLAGLSMAVAVMLCAVAVPALRLTGRGVASDLTAGARRSIGGVATTRMRRMLVTAQTALALVLLSTGALIVSTYQRSLRIDPGFDPGHVVTAQIRLSGTALPSDEDRAAYLERLLDRVRAAPGIEQAGTTLNRFQAGSSFQTVVQIEDHPLPDGQGHTVQYRRISPGYLEAMRILLLEGRLFTRDDRVGRQPVAIVSRSFARRFWPDRDPVGRRIKRGSTAQVWSVIVGVVDDVRDVAIDQAPRETVYSPYFQASNPVAPVGLVIRTAGDPRASLDAIEHAVWEVDPTQPLANVVTVDDFLEATLGPQRLRALLITACGALGLLLATIGVYGVTARAVVERRREVGIRLALGGTHREVWWTLAWGTASAVAAGAAAGAVASVLAVATLRAVLPGLQGADWLVTTLASLTLLCAGLLTALWGARAAVSVDPLTALRLE